MFYYMYILKSTKDGKLYFGYSGNLRQRLKEHNAGLVQSTKLRRLLKLIYFEGYASEEEARHREHNLKLHARALRQLLNRIDKSVNS